jgi:hypothetical protein
MKAGIDPALSKTRPISVQSIRESHNHVQFSGDGTPAHPALYNRDVFAILPFQVNARRFVIPYYVMTRDVIKQLGEERYVVRLGGIRGRGASVRAYDPVKNASIPVSIVRGAVDSLTVSLTATDYPYLLIVQER